MAQKGTPYGVECCLVGDLPLSLRQAQGRPSLPHLYTHQGVRELQARNGLFS